MAENETKKPRKRPVRSGYLFPSYDFGVARRVTERVERDGAGTLSEETLAIALGASAKSSGFRLRRLAASQFGLLTKQGDVLRTTPLAKAIIKPKDEAERDSAIAESFLNVPLFKAISTRFKGQPLPQSEAFRNILEREFRIQSNRVNEAERIFRDSAREAGLLQTSGSNIYLVTQIAPVQHTFATNVEEPQPQPTLFPTRPKYPVQPEVPISRAGDSFTVSEQDLDELTDDEFNEIWQALGKVIRARGKKRQVTEEQEEQSDSKTEIEEKE